MNTNISEIKGLRDFLRHIELLPTESPRAIYRGECQMFDHPCTPGLFREEIVKSHFPFGYKNERENVYQWFNRVTSVERSTTIASSDIERIILAQHYGLHTRLLDWTSNPLVALWFATAEPECESGFVYIHEPHEDLESVNNIYMSLDYSSAYDDRYNALAMNPFCINRQIPNISDDGKELIPFRDVHYFRPTALFDQRVMNQSAVISIHPDPHPVSDDTDQSSNHYRSLKINKDAKSRIRKEIQVLGVSEATLGLWTRESIAKQLNQSASIKNQ